MGATGIRSISSLASSIADALVARAVRQLEERAVDMIRHGHDVATPSAAGFSPALFASDGSTRLLSQPWTLKKTADTAFASATAADVPRAGSGAPAMSFPLEVGRYYRFSFESIVRSDTATVGVAMSVTCPAAAVFAASGRFVGHAADGTDAEWVGNITASDDPVVPTATVAINTDYLFIVSGLIVPSASGALTLRARTETGATTVTVRRGSLGLLWDCT